MRRTTCTPSRPGATVQDAHSGPSYSRAASDWPKSAQIAARRPEARRRCPAVSGTAMGRGSTTRGGKLDKKALRK